MILREDKNNDLEDIIMPDNHDVCLKYYEIVLERRNIENIMNYPLPEGYKYVFYRHGNKKDWIDIEMSAREFVLEEEGEEAWGKYYGGKEKELEERMIFIENSEGEKIATATAFYEPRDTSGAGWLHWVAIKREFQGRGLAKPLISRTLSQLVNLGYSHIKIPTQTTTWVAVKIYLNFGFLPIPINKIHSLEGYQIIKTLTNHPALEEFKSIPYDEIWDERMVKLSQKLKKQIPELIYFCERKWEGKRTILYCSENGRGKILFK